MNVRQLTKSSDISELIDGLPEELFYNSSVFNEVLGYTYRSDYARSYLNGFYCSPIFYEDVAPADAIAKFMNTIIATKQALEFKGVDILEKVYKILKVIVVPLIIVVLVIILLGDAKTKKQIDVLGTVKNIISTSTYNNNGFLNQDLGIGFDTPEITGTHWQLKTFENTTYYERKGPFVPVVRDMIHLLDNDNKQIVAAQVEYIDSKLVFDKKKVSQIYGFDKRNYYVELKRTQHLKELYENCEISSLSSVEINEKTFYIFTVKDSIWDSSFTVYCFRHGDFGFSFRFYDGDIKLKQDRIYNILGSIEFAKPDIEYFYYE